MPLGMEQKNILVVTFYKLTALDASPTLQHSWKTFMQARDVRGTILLTPEGVNATIAGAEQGVREVLSFLRTQPGLDDLSWKESWSELQPFERTKVKLKRETIPLGVDVDPAKACGTYVKPAEWNRLIEDPETLVIDTRNDYEVRLGTFKGALNPHTRTFKDLPAWVKQHLSPGTHKKIAMFCTGGIRCEKSTAYLKKLGFEKVYHLEGGILQYLEDVPPETSCWEGSCYVFDDRVAVDHQLAPVPEARICKACNGALIAADLRRMDTNSPGCPHCGA
jgi:UPF0176 protein